MSDQPWRDPVTELRVCLATSPGKPNLTHNARGRVPHLLDPLKRLTYIHTVCGQQVVENLNISDRDHSTFGMKPICGACRHQLAQRRPKKELMQNENAHL